MPGVLRQLILMPKKGPDIDSHTIMEKQLAGMDVALRFCRHAARPCCGPINRIVKKEQTMRRILLVIALIPLLLWGCATATSTTGSDFNSSVVPHIHEGVTTTTQLLRWLGEPYSKVPVSATEIMWLYTWARPTANLSVVPFGHRNIGTSGYMKTLWLFIKNDIVVNYSYEEGIYAPDQ